MSQIQITHLLESYVRNLSKGEFNTNNHVTNFNGETITAEQYSQEIVKTHYTKWIHLIPHDDHIIIRLTKYEQQVLRDACEVGIIAHRMSKLHEEELVEISERVDNFISGNEPYFLRIDACSPKDCPYDGPVFSGLDIVKRISTSWRCHNSLKYDDEINIILKPWRSEIDIGREFRVFVCNKRVTAISQYDSYNNHGWEQDKDMIHDIVYKTISLYDNTNYFYDNCVMDIYVNVQNDVELIEFNSFGMEMASGSALFEWVKDRNQLYGLTDYIEVRIVN